MEEEMLRADTKKRTATRKEYGFPKFSTYQLTRKLMASSPLLNEKRTAQHHELHDSPWVWLAAPLLLLALLVVGWVRMKINI